MTPLSYVCCETPLLMATWDFRIKRRNVITMNHNILVVDDEQEIADLIEVFFKDGEEWLH